MALRRAKSSFSAGLQILLQPGQDLLVDPGVWVQSTDLFAIGARIAGQTLRIAGIVQAQDEAIRFGNLLDGESSLTAQGRVTMVVESSGKLLSDSGTATLVNADSASIYNRGFVAGQSGIVMLQSETTSLADRRPDVLVNSGTILARDGIAVKAEYGFGVLFRLVNSGKILAPETKVGNDAIVLAVSRYEIVNSGTVYGDLNITATKGVLTNTGRMIVPQAIQLTDGADVFRNFGVVTGENGGPALLSMQNGQNFYDGLHGYFYGTVSGGTGSNRYMPGRGVETIVGGGADTLDFSQTAGVRVDITNSAFNRGVAAGDTYQNMNTLLGSNRGADFFIGGVAAERLVGNGGADTLVGMGGADTLQGGLGRDRLTGGDGDDAFHFRSSSEGADIITDFSNNLQDDRIEILAGFGLRLATGPLAAAYFRAGASHRAADRNDFFLFDTRDDSLWFDRDGSGGRYAPVKLAQFLGDPVITAADIYILGL